MVWLADLKLKMCTIDLPGGLSMRRGSSVREECDHFTRDEKAHRQSAGGLMHSPDYGNEKAIIHITNVVHIWESAPTWRMFFYQNIFYCNKVNTAVTFLFAHCADRTHLCPVKKGNLKPASVKFQLSMGRLKSFSLQVLTGYTPDSVT